MTDTSVATASDARDAVPYRLLVVTGPPGSGKSVVARALADTAERCVVVHGDDFFAFVRSGAVPPWLPEADVQNGVVTDAAAAATGRFVRGGYPVVYDGVVGPWFLPRFLAAADVTDADYVVLLPPLATCVERVRRRTGHGFTDVAATGRMHAEFVVAGVEPRHVLDDAAADVAAVVTEVRRRQHAGTLTVRR